MREELPAMTTPIHAGMPCDPLTLEDEAELRKPAATSALSWWNDGWDEGYDVGWHAGVRHGRRVFRFVTAIALGSVCGAIVVVVIAAVASRG